MVDMPMTQKNCLYRQGVLAVARQESRDGSTAVEQEDTVFVLKGYRCGEAIGCRQPGGGTQDENL